MELKLEDIVYEYDVGTDYVHRALDGINLSVSDNEFIGLIGHTGSGKSTLIQHMNGLLKASSGRVLWNGQDIFSSDFDRKKLRGHIGLVFQYPEYQLFETDVLKDVCFGPKNMGLSDEESEKKAKEALNLVGIDSKYYKVSPFDLSGGEKRRVAIAGVLAMRPEILILDEPTAGLDPKGRDDILAGISRIREETGSTVILVSHSMDDIAEYVNRVIVINKGKIEFDDKPRNVFSHIERLEEMGLSAPQIYYITRHLKKSGINVNEDSLTISEARDSILADLRRQNV